MRTLQPCGTMAAWKRHWKRGEQPCEPCAEAMRAEYRERYSRTKCGKSKRAAAKQPRELRTVICPVCQSHFVTPVLNKVFCSPRCRAADRKTRAGWPQARQVVRLGVRPDDSLIRLRCFELDDGGLIVACHHCPDLMTVDTAPSRRSPSCGERVTLV